MCSFWDMRRRRKSRRSRESANNPVELGTIEYLNLKTVGTKHGDFDMAVNAAKEHPEKPIFACFAEWPGCTGSKDSGRIFADPVVKKVAEEYFTPVAFNTWDRYTVGLNQAHMRWAGSLQDSDWGYLVIIDQNTNNTLSSTGKLYGYKQFDEVLLTLRKAIEATGQKVPRYLDNAIDSTK